MEGSITNNNGGGDVKHILLAKFKPEVSQHEIDELIKGYAHLEYVIPSVKTFAWGLNVSTEGLDQGFTHVFELGFNTVAGIQQYLADPNHIQYANLLLPKLEKVLVVDYKPTAIPH